MRRRSLLICIVSTLVTLAVFSGHYSYLCLRFGRFEHSLALRKGTAQIVSICATALHFLAALTGNVATSSCSLYDGPYPPHQIKLTPFRISPFL